MSTKYEPGTVAVANFCGDLNVRVSRYDHGWARLTNPDDFSNDDDRYEGGEPLVTDVRPLVVLDREDREQCRGLADRIAPNLTGNTNAVQAALREFGNPKPVEPTGLGAVVEDAAGCVWVRSSLVPSAFPWDMARDREMSGFSWSQIDAVRVLSEGVTQ